MNLLQIVKDKILNKQLKFRTSNDIEFIGIVRDVKNEKTIAGSILFEKFLIVFEDDNVAKFDSLVDEFEILN
jgi:hypothetical protein